MFPKPFWLVLITIATLLPWQLVGYCEQLPTSGELNAVSFLSLMDEQTSSVPLKANVRKEAQQEPGVIGVDLLIFKNRHPIVNQVFPGLPAHRKGIRPGDTILAINGFSTLGKSDLEIDRFISDVPGTSVSVKIQRGFMVAQVILTVESLSYIPNSVRLQYANVSFDSYYDIP